ncbi:MAG: phenylacetate--CoA ligase family protein, partial [Oscillospiraceae bacterium]|nr:phenylacetate--CoA ligase family protein [Oscillospiraceae bacterium]
MKAEALPAVTRESLDALQLKKLNAVLKREKARGGFYKNLPEHLDSLDELWVLPFTTEEDLAQNAPGLLLCSQAEIQRILSDATSGTTGAAKRVFYTEGDLEGTVELFMAGLGELI